MATLADLQQRLATVRGKERKIILAAGLFRVVVTFAVAVVVYFLIDWLLELPYAARLACAGAGLALVGWVLNKHVVRELRKIQDDEAIALRLEARNPDLRSRLISTLQLARAGRGGEYVGSPELIAALEAETLRMSEPMDFLKIVDRETLMRFAVAAAVVLAIKAALIYKFPEHFLALAARLVHKDARYPTRTRILEIRRPLFVARGEKIAVEVRVDTQFDVPQEKGTLYFSSVGRDAGAIAVELVPDGVGVFTGALAKALDDVTFKVHLGDARSEEILVSVLPRPEVDVAGSGECIRYTLPAYTEQPQPPAERFGALSALIGSKASVRFRSTKPLASAAFERDDKDLFPAVCQDDEGLVWEVAGMPLDKPGTFHVNLVDRGLSLGELTEPEEKGSTTLRVSAQTAQSVAPGQKVKLYFGPPGDFSTVEIKDIDGNSLILAEPLPRSVQPAVRPYLETVGLANSQPPVEYPIDARPDNPPVIRLTKPTRDLTVTPNARLNIACLAHDDWGLRTIWIVYRIQNESQLDSVPSTAAVKTERIERPVAKKPPQPITFQWELAGLKVKPGDQIVFWLESDDHCTTNDKLTGRAPRPGEPVPDPNAKVYSRSQDIKLTVVSKEDKALELQAEVERLYQLLQTQTHNQEEIKAKVIRILEELKRLEGN